MKRLLNRFTLCIIFCTLTSSFGQLLPLQGGATAENNLKEITVENNEFIDESLILKRISVVAGQNYHPVVLKNKIKASVESLYETGLFANIDVGIIYGESGEVSFIFTVEEHPQLKSYSITGNEEIADEEIDVLVTLVEGQVISPSDIERNRQRIISRYKEDGFLLAEVVINKNIDPESGKVELVLDINEGDKVVVQEIIIHGNTNVHSSDIIDNLESEVDHWWGEGEYKEESFEADSDSILAIYRSKGYLDAAVTHKEIEYIKDPSFRFYSGQALKEGYTSEQLITAVTKALANESSAFYDAVRTSLVRSNHYYRHARRNIAEKDQAVLLPKLDSEEKILTLLNRILMLKEVRQDFIQQASPTVHTPEIDSLTTLKTLDDLQEKRLARLTLEALLPLMPYDELNTSSNLGLHFTVSEGRQYYSGTYTFIGNKVYSTEALESQLTLDSGDIFDNSKYQMLLYNLQSMYREEGYLFVQIIDKKEYRDSIVDISFDITEGLPASIHKVLIKNNTTTKDKVVRREVKLFPGDTYRQSLMERSIRDIMQLNYFDNVMPDIKIRENQEVDLVFDAMEREAGTGQFSAGVAYSQKDNFMGTLGLTIPNCCIGDGQQASLNVEFGQEKQNYTIGFTEPWFQDRPITLGGTLNYTWYKSDYSVDNDIRRYGGRMFLGTRLKWPDDYFYIQGDISWQMNQQGTNVPGSVLLKSGSESAVGLTITRDDKNLPRFPTEGSRYSVSVEKVFQVPGVFNEFSYNAEPLRQFSYLKTDFTVKWWFPLGGGLALGLDNQVGLISGDVLQYRSRYQMGGMLGYQGKLRGYSPGSIGSSRLGRSFVSMVSEITYPIAENTFYALAFFDAGNVYGEQLYTPIPGSSDIRERLITKEEVNRTNPLSEFTPQSLKKDFGFGFRIVVPMLGIIGFDFGWPLDDGERPQGVSTSRAMQTNFVISQGF
ncbi:MAG: BamA/TamA family outer membrane protein [Fibrobacterales bacterium]